ncbi:MAG: DUF1848 domain-containing protein [Planctomycetota bacterium]
MIPNASERPVIPSASRRPVILSASRRTDIPAFYAKWFLNRIRAGTCLVLNPFRPSQASRISLLPEDLDAIFFWTRDPRPMLPGLPELDRRGHRYLFQITLLDYPRAIDPASPPIGAVASAFAELADRIGPDRVIWRYDPIVLGAGMEPEAHVPRFERIAGLLRGKTKRVIVSVLDRYRKIESRIRGLAAAGIEVAERPEEMAGFPEAMRGIADCARDHGMEIQSCAEQIDLAPFGIPPGSCIDEGLLARAFGLPPGRRKDPSQRPRCRCVESRDIGAYDTCLFGCAYCYATQSRERAARNYAMHDPAAEALVGMR